MFFFFFDDEQKHAIFDMQQHLLETGEIRPEEQLKSEYAVFRKRFGPDTLRGLEGEALIDTIFNMMNRDSLAYWLEFKNEELFNTLEYGSVAGGASHKYIMYKRKADGKWVTGIDQQELSLGEAIQKGTDIRDAILRGVDYIGRLAPGEEGTYIHLQELLDQEPEYKVGRYGWIHKYYHMIFPDRIDTYHSTAFQQHALLCSGIKPMEQLYPLSGQLMQRINELSPMLVCHAQQAMGRLYGVPINYFRIGTNSDSTGSMWDNMRHGEYVSIGWKELGDLRSYVAEDDSKTKEKIRQAHEPIYQKIKQITSREVNEIFRFFRGIKEDDIVAACAGETLLGVGRVTGDYEYHKELEFPHLRMVEWFYTGKAKLPEAKEGLQTTVTQYKDLGNMLRIRELAAGGEKSPEGEKQTAIGIAKKLLPPLADEIKRVESILERKKQVILYGPPGTGKTYYAEKVAQELGARRRFQKTFDSLAESERHMLMGNGREEGLIRICCFHPSYGYEDFIEGIKPRAENGNTVFELRDGIFKRICKDAQAQPDDDFFLIIDEINRGDISRIFGELIMLIEKSKRGKALYLPVSGDAFLVPQNVYLIGTMNTADRSIALLDVALRRRFGFKEFFPQYELLEDISFGNLPLAEWLRKLNQRICDALGRDARNMQIGHSYFMEEGKAVISQSRFKKVLAEDVLPLIEEYCYGDYAKMAMILGNFLVDINRQTLQYQLFEGGFDELESALLQPCPEIRKPEAIASNAGNDLKEEADEEAGS